MAQTTLKLTATADTSDAKRKLDDLKKQSIDVQEEIAQKNRERLKEAIGLIAPVAVGVQALMRVIDGAITKVQEFIGRVASYRDTYAKAGADLDALAKNLNATTAETIRLQAAADAAGIGAKDYAAALDKIKAGTVTLDQQAAAWESIASSTAIAQSRSRLFASYLANASKQREIEIGAAEDVAAQLGGLGTHGEIAQSFLDEVLAGRTTKITSQEYIRRATERGIGLQTLGIDAETIPIVIRALNDMIREQQASRQAAQSAEEKRQADFADALFRQAERFLSANGGNWQDALARVAAINGLTLADAEKWYARGLGQLSAEERNLRQIREEQARAKADEAEAAARLDQAQNRPWERYGYDPAMGTNAAAEEGAVSAAAAALKWAFSEGGGLLSGVNYGFSVFNRDPADKIVSAVRDSAKETNATLKSIDKTLKDD